MKNYLPILNIVLCGLICFAAKESRADEAVETPSISVTGSAMIRVVPDEVVLRVSVESRAKVLGDATSDNEKKIAKVLEFLKSSGIPATGIRTEIIRIEPVFPSRNAKYQQDSPFGDGSPAPGIAPDPLKPTGYTVKRQLSITTGKLNEFETIYRGLIERGINQVGGMTFQSTKLREHRDQARINATRAAKEKAEALAKELGATLAGVQTITESSDGDYRRNVFQNRVTADPFGGPPSVAESIAAGQIEISASVYVVFRMSSTDFDQ